MPAAPCIGGLPPLIIPGMTEPAQNEIAELVRRLENSPYPIADIREAGELLAGAFPREATYRMALGYWESQNGQVRVLGLAMMQAISPSHEGARGFVAGAKGAGNLPTETKSDKPDYSAIGEVIKHWMREHRRQRNGGR